MSRDLARILLGLSLLTASAACAGEEDGPREPDEPIDPEVAIDLRVAMGRGDVTPVGVTVEPVSGRRLILDEQHGIYQLGDDDLASPLVAMADMPPSGVEVRLPFTDLVALGDSQLALTAIGDGFVLDLAADTLSLRFCYEPGEWDEDMEQRTDAVTYDGPTDSIFAQPRTYNVVDPETTLGSQIGTYQRTTGLDVAWSEVPIEFVAGGMAVLPGHGLVLGAGDQLFRHDGTQLVAIDSLARFEVSSIDGLAFDPTTDELLVVDGEADALYEIPLADLAD